MKRRRYKKLRARLEALEDVIFGGCACDDCGGPPPSPSDYGPGWARGGECHCGGSGFDEKRVVDLIVRLVHERVEQTIERRFDERRLVDLIVRLVSERIEEKCARLAETLAASGVAASEDE